VKKPFPKIAFAEIYFFPDRNNFVVYGSPCTVFSSWRCTGFFIKDVSRRRELAGGNVDKNVLCTWMLFSPVLRYCNKRRGLYHRAGSSSGWVGTGWGSWGGEWTVCVWRWEKVPEVKTDLKWWSKVGLWTGLVQRSLLLPTNNPPIDSVLPNEFFLAMGDFCLAIFHSLFLLEENAVQPLPFMTFFFF